MLPIIGSGSDFDRKSAVKLLQNGIYGDNADRHGLERMKLE